MRRRAAAVGSFDEAVGLAAARLRATHPAFAREITNAEGRMSTDLFASALRRLGLAPSGSLLTDLGAAQRELDETRRIGTSRKRVGQDRLTPRG